MNEVLIQLLAGNMRAIKAAWESGDEELVAKMIDAIIEATDFPFCKGFAVLLQRRVESHATLRFMDFDTISGKEDELGNWPY